jgi:hypothetical protein
LALLLNLFSSSLKKETMTDNARRPLGKHRARERNFRFSDYSKPQSKAPKDDRTLNRKGPQVEIVRPKWNGAAPMTFRPLPMLCAEDPSRFDPTRLTTDEYDFSDFMRSIPSVKYVGIDQKFTFLSYDPRRTYNSAYNPRTDNPYHVLYNAVMDAVKKTGEAKVNGRDVMTGKWAPLVSDGPMKAFNNPSKMYFLQGVVFESDGDLFIKGGSPPKGLRDGDLPQIIELSKSAGDKIAKKLNLLNPDYTGDNDVEYQDQMYAYGDVVDLTNGMFFTLFNPDKHSNVVDLLEDLDGAAEENEGGYTSWGVGINPTFDYVAKRQPVSISADISQYADRIANQIVPWDDILYFPPDEEICLWMAQAFRSMPTLLEFGWQDHPEFFTDEVQGILSNRTQATGAAPNEEDDEDDTPVIAPKASRQAVKPARASSLPKYEEPVQDASEETESEEADNDYEDAVEPDVVINSGPAWADVASEEEVDAEAGDEDFEEEEDVTQEDEDEALAAMERARLRSKPVAVGPASPPPRAGKAKVVSKPTPVRKTK